MVVKPPKSNPILEMTGMSNCDRSDRITVEKRMTLVCQDEQRVPLGRPGLMDLIKARRHQIEFEKEVLDILEDGRIDRSDRITVEKIRQDYPKAVKAMNNIYYAVVEAYDGSEGTKR